MTNNWHRFDPNSGWKPVPPCEAAAILADHLFPIALGDPGREVGEKLWVEQGFAAAREAVRLKLLQRYKRNGTSST